MKPHIERVRDTALSWPRPADSDYLLGGRMLYNGGRVRSVRLALTRVILRTNPRILPVNALLLSDATVRAASAQGLPPEFLGATLLQESAFDPQAFSSAGAYGIAQFMPTTAAEENVDPTNPYDAIRGAATLLASYVRTYRFRFSDPYAVALAAYNAGPGAVEAYHGVPPYTETREYIEDIAYRWRRIAAFEVHPRSRENLRDSLQLFEGKGFVR